MRIIRSSAPGMSAARIEMPSSSSCDRVGARRVMRSSRAATRIAPTAGSGPKQPETLGGGRPCRWRCRNTLRLGSIQPWAVTNALTAASWASRPRPLWPCSAVETRYRATAGGDGVNDLGMTQRLLGNVEHPTIRSACAPCQVDPGVCLRNHLPGGETRADASCRAPAECREGRSRNGTLTGHGQLR